MVSDNKFRLEMPDKKLEKEALYNFVVKTECKTPAKNRNTKHNYCSLGDSNATAVITCV